MIMLYECDEENESQKWVYNRSNWQIQLKSHPNLCLDYVAEDVHKATQSFMTLEECINTNPSQRHLFEFLDI